MEVVLRSYKQLESIQKEDCYEIYIFGAGKMGRGLVYDMLSAAGLYVKNYIDNYVPSGTVIHDILVRDMSFLSKNADNAFVFACFALCDRESIRRDLEVIGVINYCFVDLKEIAYVAQSVDEADDYVKKNYYRVYDDEYYLKSVFYRYHGYELNLNHPRSFNEKIQWLKLHDYKPWYTNVVDKIKFKEFIREKIGSEFTIPIIGNWESFDEIDFSELGEPIVLKCTHDSASTVIIHDKCTMDLNLMRSRFENALQLNYYWLGREKPYKYAQRRIIAEPFLNDDSGELRDYKVFCFDGSAYIIQVDFNRFSNHKRNLYDKEWKYINAAIRFETDPSVSIERPKCLDEMIEIAEVLSKGLRHVRVDFYIVNEKPIVGEMTFYHGGGMEWFSPNELNYKMGDLIKIED